MKGLTIFFCGLILTATTVTAGDGTKIRIAGAGGMIPLVTDLAKAYMAEKKDILIEVNQRSIESTGGVMSAAEGKIEIGMSARALKDDEKKLGLHSVEIARTATVVGVNRSVSVREISSDHLCRVFAGRVTDWKDLGGGKGSIVALSRPDRDATKESIRKNVPCYKDLTEPSSVVTIATSPEMTKVLSGRPDTIGFTDSVAVDSSAGAIVPLRLDGVAPTPENVMKGKYKVIKNNFLLVKGQPSGHIKDFIEFVKGPKGSRIIEAHKAVPIK